MNRNTLISLLEQHTTANELEEQMRSDMLDFVKENELCFERTLEAGHVTASGWVISLDKSKTLMMHHRKLDKWFQPGGHCDGDPDVRAVARKEIEEETGLVDFSLTGNGIFDIDIHEIPENKKEKAHLHYDVRFLFEADPAVLISGNSESREVKWIDLEKVADYNNSESILRMARKVIASQI